ncbi:MAG: putative membrane protein [Candidatus Azotimanducaceae bacterium]|jgi:uncharacterized membrane protein
MGAPGDQAMNVKKDEPYKESHLRSLLKATSWRVLATLTTTIIAYLITGEVETALTIGSIEFVFKFMIYYFHERAWQLVPRGGIRRLVVRFFPALKNWGT